MNKTNILVVGGGGREHAIVWKLRQSPDAGEIFCAPGNGGIASEAVLVPNLPDGDWKSFADFADQKNIGLVVVGPEDPLTRGLSDALRARGIKVIGPDASGARLEGSKVFSKQFMKKYGIPTADFQVFEKASEAASYVAKNGRKKFVVKADGLAAGKGVAVCGSMNEALSAIENMMVRKAFGAAGERIIIEDRLEGQEVSVIAFCDGNTIKPLPLARDHKRAYDNDEGPNTGGMGAVAPRSLPAPVWKEIEDKVIHPFLAGIQAEGMDYRGIIYFGLMLTDKGVSVLEFNVRFGDPETQVILPLLDSDLLHLFQAVESRTLDQVPVNVSSDFCVGVVCVSGGYPGKFEKGKHIEGLGAIDTSKGDLMVFHSGTVLKDRECLTNGGRVLTVAAKAGTQGEAKGKAYRAVSGVFFDKMHFRKDIAAE